MNRYLNKKGFTIVELVIVIAVIAILAAVLIPTFSGIVQKANLSNDVQICKNMNTQLATDFPAGISYPANINVVKQSVDSYKKNFGPQTDGYHYYWKSESRTVYLVNDSNGKFEIYFPEEGKEDVNKENSYRLDSTFYSVTTSFTHCDADKTIDIIEKGNDIKLVITPEVSFYNPLIENIIVTGGDKKWDETTNTLTVEKITGNVTISVTSLNNKGEQAAPLAPVMNGKTDKSITLDAITTTGHGSIEYAKNTTESAPTEGWQTSVDFTGLTSGTTYYFFSRYAGDDNYNSSPASTASAAYTTLYVYNIDVTGVSNATGAVTNPTTIVEGSTNVSLTFSADTNYKLPEDVTVTGATKTSWTKNTGVLVIANPTANVSITITAELDAFTVTFDKQSGTGGSDSVSATYGQAMPEITVPSRTGYKFNGYYSNTNGTGTQYYDKDGVSQTSYALTTTTTLYAYWTSAWKSLKVNVNGTDVNYYPVLGGTNPEPDLFAYSTDGTTFTEIAKPNGGYKMSDVATYAKAGTLYYCGGAVLVVRTVQLSWDKTFDGNNVSSDDVNHVTGIMTGADSISVLIDATVENVENVAMESQGSPTTTPTISGVNLQDIWNTYKANNYDFSDKAIGGFWTNVKDYDNSTKYAMIYGASNNTFSRRQADINSSVLISRIFN